MVLQFIFVLTAIAVGARLGGIGLGVMGGTGLAVLTFVFGLQPTSPPIDVMLMIASVISAAACHLIESFCYLFFHFFGRYRPCCLFSLVGYCRSGYGDENTSGAAVGYCCDCFTAGYYCQPYFCCYGCYVGAIGRL